MLDEETHGGVIQTSEHVFVLPQAATDQQYKEALERDIIEGCREMAEVYLEVHRDFDPLDTEVTRDFYPG